MLSGKLPLTQRRTKSPMYWCLPVRTFFVIGVAFAIAIHFVTSSVLSPVSSDIIQKDSRAPQSPIVETRQPVEAPELSETVQQKVSVQEGNDSAFIEDENDKEEENLGVISRGRKRQLSNEAAHQDEDSEGPQQNEHDENDTECLPMLLYDKPMKTGSTAVTSAIEVLLNLHNETSLVCTLAECGEYAVKLCANERPKIHLIDHIAANVSTALCLKDMGYYSATSIRDPTDRWNSAYLFNQGKKKDHYGLSHKLSYDEFMERIPNCSLLAYYDRGSPRCTEDVESPEIKKRIENIIQRFDEIIDLYGEPLTDLHKRLMPFLAKENVSKRTEKVSLGTIPKERLVYEQALYDALVKRRFELAERPNPSRRLCKKPRIPKW